MTDTIAERLARLGYVARGLVYILVGGLALVAAFDRGGSPPGTKGALASLLSEPYGAVMLGAIALGLVCFAAWRLAQAFADADHLGRGRKAKLTRAARAGGAIVSLGLAGSVVALMIGAGSASDDAAARDWTAAVMSVPLGQWLVGIAGLGIAGGGVAIAVKGWTADFAQRLVLPEGMHWIVPLGRFAYVARGGLFVLVGVLVALAALHADAREAKGLAGALQALQQQPYGWALLGLAAAGLFAFGVVMLVMARYRRIDARRMNDAARRAEHKARAALAG